MLQFTVIVSFAFTTAGHQSWRIVPDLQKKGLCEHNANCSFLDRAHLSGIAPYMKWVDCWVWDCSAN